MNACCIYLLFFVFEHKFILNFFSGFLSKSKLCIKGSNFHGVVYLSLKKYLLFFFLGSKLMFISKKCDIVNCGCCGGR